MSTLHLFNKKKICSVGIKGGYVRGEGRASQEGGGGKVKGGCTERMLVGRDSAILKKPSPYFFNHAP